jgi:uncharacterized membrane protein
MLDIGLTYAWNWTDSHNKSLTQYMNFWLLITAFVITAYLAGLTNRLPIVAAAVALLAATSAPVFLYEIRRMQVNLELGERALIALEKVVADGLCINELRILSQQHHAAEGRRIKILTYVLFIGGAVMWSGAAVYAFTRS